MLLSDLIAPEPARRTRAPLSTAALIVGLVLCVLAVAAGALPSIAQQLASDPLVMRALGATVGTAAYMLLRVAIATSAGVQRALAVCLAVPLAVLAATLLAVPSVATAAYADGRSTMVPWLIALPGILSLLLSRWPVR